MFRKDDRRGIQYLVQAGVPLVKVIILERSMDLLVSWFSYFLRLVFGQKFCSSKFFLKSVLELLTSFCCYETVGPNVLFCAKDFTNINNFKHLQ